MKYNFINDYIYILVNLKLYCNQLNACYLEIITCAFSYDNSSNWLSTNYFILYILSVELFFTCTMKIRYFLINLIII